MLDKAEYSAFESTLNSPIVSYQFVQSKPYIRFEKNYLLIITDIKFMVCSLERTFSVTETDF